MPSGARIVVTGLIGQHPGLGGMTWHYLQYVLGLARLGHDVLYLEDSGEWPYEPDEGAVRGAGPSCGRNVRHLAAAMARAGLANRWAFRCPVDGHWFGVPDRTRAALLRSAELLINVSGSLEQPSAYRDIPVLAYVDTDPVFAQLRLARGPSLFRDLVDAHDVHFTFGERLPEALRATGHRWRPTRQPVVIAEWAGRREPGRSYTTVMSWSSYASETHGGRRYGQKDVELLRFVDLPRRCAASLELAVDFRPPYLAGREAPTTSGDEPARLLASHGWRLVDPVATCGTPDAYRDYVVSSRGEWTVAKNAYVAGPSGWFSERSACYLAAGRPVIAQDTGFSDVLPVGEGLLAFTGPDEAAAALDEVERDHARHARAARAIAAEYFDSGAVLSRLLADATSPDGRYLPGRGGKSLPSGGVRARGAI
jgi:hypothetical protein